MATVKTKRLRHWQAVAISSAEQCGRARVRDSTGDDTVGWFDSGGCDLRLVSTPPHRAVLNAALAPLIRRRVIGPEGGLSLVEITAAETRPASPVALGPARLRTATPVAAMALCQWLWGDIEITPDRTPSQAGRQVIDEAA